MVSISTPRWCDPITQRPDGVTQSLSDPMVWPNHSTPRWCDPITQRPVGVTQSLERNGNRIFFSDRFVIENKVLRICHNCGWVVAISVALVVITSGEHGVLRLVLARKHRSLWLQRVCITVYVVVLQSTFVRNRLRLDVISRYVTAKSVIPLQ